MNDISPVLFHSLKKWLHAASLDERRCLLCHVPFSAFGTPPLPGVPGDMPLCPSCRKQLYPIQEAVCPLCGELSPDGLICTDCQTTPPPWEHVRCVGSYSGVLKTLLLRGKFGADPAILSFLGHLLAYACRDLPRPDAIIPIPLHVTRLRERGFNQCQELARPLSQHRGIPLTPRLLARTLPTRHQTGLSREERTVNLEHAFRASPEVRRKRLLLIDDTYTTGTTLRRACETLLEAGAASVDVAVVARTQHRDFSTRHLFGESSATPDLSIPTHN